MDDIGVIERRRPKAFGIKSIPLLVVCVLTPVAVGALASFLTKNNMYVFDNLKKPMFTPPAIVFPIVWSLIYVMMGAGLYLALRNSINFSQKMYVIYPYAIQLLLNFCWSLIFFNLRSYIAAFVCLALMLIMIVRTIVVWSHVSKASTYPMIVYLLWVVFAGYLNLAIVLMN